jgi:preprotein translocase subunit SecB
MADEEQPAATNENNSPVILPQSIYIKDVSFETPNSPEIFTAKWEPEVKLLMDSASKDLGDDIYEVVLTFTVTVNVGGKTAYLAEVHQAGIFVLKGMTPEQLHRTQHVFCLRFLHPYAIAAILDLITKGGFPQFLMPPVNFGERYTERYENTEKTSEPEAS